MVNPVKLAGVFDIFLKGYGKDPQQTYLVINNREISYADCYALIQKLAPVAATHRVQDQLMVLPSGDPLAFVAGFWTCMAIGTDVLLCSDIRTLDETYQQNHVLFDYSTFLQEAGASDSEGEQLFYPATEAHIFFLTSGTTGTPKLICNAGWQLVQAMEQVAVYPPMNYLRYCHSCLLTLPLNHSYGLSSLVEYTLHGCTVVLPKDNALLSCLQPLMDKNLPVAVESVEGVPVLYEQLMKIAGRAKLANIKHIGLGADHVHKQLLEKLQSFMPEVNFTVRYGLTEIPSVLAVQSFNTLTEYIPAAVYNWLPLYHLYTTAPGAGVETELLVEYKAYPGINTVATGDLVTVQDNRFILKGRTAAVFKYKGMKVNPVDIERVIGLYPAVTDAVVYLDDDGRLNANLVVSHTFSRTALQNLLLQELPPYMIPDKIHMVEAVQRTATGKIVRTK